MLHCPECDYCSKRSTYLRMHYKEKHPTAHPYDLEYRIITTVNPELDVDLLLVRYLDHKETVIGLNKQGIFVKHFLQKIGVARTDRDDKALMGRMKLAHRTDEQILKTNINKSLVHYRNKNFDEEELEEIAAILTTLKLVKYVKKKMAEASEPKAPKEPEPPEEKLIGRFTARFAAEAAALAALEADNAPG